MNAVVYTIGHSRHTADYFLELLSFAGVNCVIDVRSIAASRFNPQFGKSKLSALLDENGIRYFHLPEEFGGHQNEHVRDENQQVDFEKVRQTQSFSEGIKLLKNEIYQGFVPVLMCSEADPLECHRFSMIAVALKGNFRVRHILKDKTIIENEQLEELLLMKFRKKIPAPNLFEKGNRALRLNKAYRLINSRIGFSVG